MITMTPSRLTVHPSFVAEDYLFIGTGNRQPQWSLDLTPCRCTPQAILILLSAIDNIYSLLKFLN